MLFPTLLGDTVLALGAQIPSASFATSGQPSFGTLTSGVQFHSDGNVYRYNGQSGTQKVGTWLLSGANTAYHIHRTINSGTLSPGADGTDNVVLSTTRIYNVTESSPSSSKTCTVTFRISNVADSVTYDTRAYTFTATMESQ